MAKLTKIASLEAHRTLHRAVHGARRVDQGQTLVARARLDLERELRKITTTINETEEVIARLPDDLGIKPGQRSITFGPWSISFVLSTKPELRELVRVLRERRADLMNGEGRRRIGAAEGLRDHLRETDRIEALVGKRLPEPDEPEELSPPKPPSKWG